MHHRLAAAPASYYRRVDHAYAPYEMIPQDVVEAFMHFDRNETGFLDYRELADALSWYGVDTSLAEAIDLLRQYDEYPDGRLDLAEFASLIEDMVGVPGWEWQTRQHQPLLTSPRYAPPCRYYERDLDARPAAALAGTSQPAGWHSVGALQANYRHAYSQAAARRYMASPNLADGNWTPVALPPYTGAVPSFHHLKPPPHAPPPLSSSRPALLYNHSRPYALAPAARVGQRAACDLTLGDVFEMHDVERRGVLDASALRGALAFLGAGSLSLSEAIDLTAIYGAAPQPGMDVAYAACTFPEFAALVRDLRSRGDLPPLDTAAGY